MGLTLDEELRLPGLRLRHPSDAEVQVREIETRRYRIRRVRVRSPWLVSEAEPSQADRFRIRVLIFEAPGNEPVGDLLEEGYVQPRPGEFDLIEGEFAGRDAVLRRPVDSQRGRPAAYVVAGARFFFVEWEGPADAVLDTVELEPSDDEGAEAEA